MNRFHRPLASAARALVAALALLCWPTFAADINETRTFEIKPQRMDRALIDFSKQAGFQVVADSADLSALQTQGVAGRKTVASALNELLAGSGLSYRVVKDDVLTIEPTNGRSQRGGQSENPTLLAQAPNQGAGASELQRAEAGDRAATMGEKIEVTGSRIAHDFGPREVIRIQRSDIEHAGAGTLRDALRTIPQVSLSGEESSSSSFSGGTNVQLRGFPSGSTLTLLNGRRVTPSSVEGGNVFDLNSLPVAAIESVEVLAEAGSAAYGADAVAGVVNFKLRKKIEQTVVDARYGTPTLAGGGAEARASLVSGFDRGGASGLIALDIYQRDELLGASRDRVSNCDYRSLGGQDLGSPSAYPGNVYSLTAGNLPGLTVRQAAIPPGAFSPMTLAAFSGATGALNHACSSGSTVATGTTRAAWLLNLSKELSRAFELFSEAMASHVKEDLSGNYFPLSGGSSGRVSVAANNPYNPFGTRVGLDYRLVDAGKAHRGISSDFGRLLLGARGAFAKTWEYETALLGTYTRSFVREIAQISTARVQDSLNATDPALALNVFTTGPAGSPSLIDSFRLPDRTIDGRTSHLQADAFARGTLVELPAGELEGVIGVEARKEKLKSIDTLSFQFYGERSVTAVFGEALVPLVSPKLGVPGARQLTISLAARSDNYSDFGRSTNPYVGLTWETVEGISLRASHGTSFKPPTLTQLFAGTNTIQGQTVTDPRRGNATNLVTSTSGSSADLKTETGRTFSGGIDVFLPSDRRWQLSLFTWKLKQSDRVVFPRAQAIVDNEALFATRITRAAPTPADAARGFPGVITSVDNTAINLAGVRGSGIDLSLHGGFNVMDVKLTPMVRVAWIRDLVVKVTPSAVDSQRAGMANTDGIFAPKLKGTASLALERDYFEAFLASRYISRYHDFSTGNIDREVGSSVETDVQVTIDFARFAAWRGSPVGKTRVRLGAINVFNRMPPFSNALAGYNFYLNDVRGRFVYVDLETRF